MVIQLVGMHCRGYEVPGGDELHASRPGCKEHSDQQSLGVQGVQLWPFPLPPGCHLRSHPHQLLERQHPREMDGSGGHRLPEVHVCQSSGATGLSCGKSHRLERDPTRTGPTKMLSMPLSRTMGCPCPWTAQLLYTSSCWTIGRRTVTANPALQRLSIPWTR